MARTRRRLRSDLAYSTPDRIVVRGHDLADLIGHVGLGEFAFLELKGRLPTPQEASVFNAITITLVEHGVTPSAMATRLTYHGAPESVQGAVAAGLLGMGDRYGGPVGDVARMLQDALAASPDPGQLPVSRETVTPDADVAAVSRETVTKYLFTRRAIPGVGHPIHRPVDPRVAPLFAVAEESGLRGRFVELMEAISAEASAQTGRELPVNATGAIGALASELGFPAGMCRGLAVMARAIGLVAHIQEEIEEPMAAELWARAEEEASEHLRGRTPS